MSVSSKAMMNYTYPNNHKDIKGKKQNKTKNTRKQRTHSVEKYDTLKYPPVSPVVSLCRITIYSSTLQRTSTIFSSNNERTRITSEPVLTSKPVHASEPVLYTVVLTSKPVLTSEAVLTSKIVLTTQTVLTSEPVLTSQPVLISEPVLTSKPVLYTVVLTREPVLTSKPLLFSRLK